MIAFHLVAAAIVASSWQAQADTTGRVHGSAISSFNGIPIAGVMISAPEVHKFVVTDSTGRFVLAGLPTGHRAIRVSYEGRETKDYMFDVGDTRIAVVLDVDSVDLNPIVVEAREPNLWRDLAGFYERRRTYRGFAHFFTREDIRRARPGKLSGLLTIEGIVTRCSYYAECRPTRYTRGTLCAVPISVDGVPQREVDYDQIPIGDVAGVEVYRGVPPADLSRSLINGPGSSTWMGSGLPAAGQCGLVEIWTR